MKTPRITATATITMFGIWVIEGREERLARGLRDRASASLGVYFRDAHEITGANAYATRALVRCERCEELDELPVELEGDEAVAVRVEAGDGAGFVFDRGLEGGGFAGLEAKEESPEGADEGGFEDYSCGECGGEAEGLVEGRSQNAGGSEADEEGEEEARGKERGPLPPATRARSAAASHARGADAGDSDGRAARVSRVQVADVCGMRLAGVGAMREASDRHDAESHRARGE